MKRLMTLPLALLLLSGLSSSDARLTERQRALHALNRLTFGARPGDVDRVMQIGVDKWIDQQLHPESIPDRDIDARLAQYDTLKMSDSQIVAKYYMPIVEARKARKENATQEDLRKMIPPTIASVGLRGTTAGMTRRAPRLLPRHQLYGKTFG